MWVGQTYIATPLTVTELVLVVLVFIALPIYSWWVNRSAKNPAELPQRKVLNPPAGSVRSMIVLLVVGSFVNFLIFGESILGTNFDKILAAFDTLSVIGFFSVIEARNHKNRVGVKLEISF